LCCKKLVSSVNANKKGSLAQGLEGLDENYRKAITIEVKSRG